jgi:hypothetical protein
MNLLDFDRLYRQKVTATGLTGSVVSLELDPVDPAKIRILSHVTVENKTTAFTKVRLAIKHHSLTFYLDELDNPTAAELIVSRSDILLGEGDILVAECTGTTTADILVLTAIGTEKDL